MTSGHSWPVVVVDTCNIEMFGVDAHVHVDLEHGHATGPAVTRPDGTVPLLAAAHLEDGVS